MAALACRPRRCSVRGGSWRSTLGTGARPSGCGVFWTSRGRWRRRSGTMIPRSWRKLGGGWPASFASAWWTSISAARSREVTEKAHSGSYLLRYPDRVGQIVAAVAMACAPTPVTAKIRLGACRDTINACDVAQAVEDAGGAALTVHGRTAADMFRGSADWEEISRIKPYLYRIPLIGNGDIATPEAVVEAFRRYDVDGVMIGRAALHRPWLFRQAQAALRGEPIPPTPVWASNASFCSALPPLDRALSARNKARCSCASMPVATLPVGPAPGPFGPTWARLPRRLSFFPWWKTTSRAWSNGIGVTDVEELSQNWKKGPPKTAVKGNRFLCASAANAVRGP